MLFFVSDQNAVQNAKTEYFETIYQVEEAIKGMEQAKKGNSLIKERVDQFHTRALENEEELAATYSWKPNLDF